MRSLGAFLILCGGVGLVYALRMDTTVEGVHNLGLMDQRQVVLFVSGLALLGGFIFTGADAVAKQVAKVVGNETGDPPKRTAPAIAEPRTATAIYDLCGTGGAKTALVIGVGLAAFLLAVWAFTRM